MHLAQRRPFRARGRRGGGLRGADERVLEAHGFGAAHCGPDVPHLPRFGWFVALRCEAALRCWWVHEHRAMTVTVCNGREWRRPAWRKSATWAALMRCCARASPVPGPPSPREHHSSPSHRQLLGKGRPPGGALHVGVRGGIRKEQHLPLVWRGRRGGRGGVCRYRRCGDPAPGRGAAAGAGARPEAEVAQQLLCQALELRLGPAPRVGVGRGARCRRLCPAARAAALKFERSAPRPRGRHAELGPPATHLSWENWHLCVRFQLFTSALDPASRAASTQTKCVSSPLIVACSISVLHCHCEFLNAA